MAGQSVECPTCNNPIVVTVHPSSLTSKTTDGIPFPKVIALVAVCSIASVLLSVVITLGVIRKSSPSELTPTSEPEIPLRSLVSAGSAPREKPPTSTVAADDQAKSAIRRCIDGLMREQEKGRIGTSYWESEILAKQFFTPTSWNILDITVFRTMASATVRIESSTKGGMPIRTTWTFHMSNKNGWKVSLISEG